MPDLIVLAGGIKKNAATLLEVYDKAQEIKKNATLEMQNMVCHTILNSYKMAYDTANTLLQIPNQVVGLAKGLVENVAAIPMNELNTAFKAITDVATSLPTKAVKAVLDATTGSATSIIENNKEFLGKAVGTISKLQSGLNVANQCPLLQGTDFGNKCKEASDLINSLMPSGSGGSIEDAIINSVTGMVNPIITSVLNSVHDKIGDAINGLMSSVKNTAIGQIDNVKKMYDKAIADLGIENYLNTMEQGLKCLDALCADDNIWKSLKDYDLDDMLKKSGFVQKTENSIGDISFSFLPFSKATDPEGRMEAQTQATDMQLYTKIAEISDAGSISSPAMAITRMTPKARANKVLYGAVFDPTQQQRYNELHEALNASSEAEMIEMVNSCTIPPETPNVFTVRLPQGFASDAKSVLLIQATTPDVNSFLEPDAGTSYYGDVKSIEIFHNFAIASISIATESTAIPNFFTKVTNNKVGLFNPASLGENNGYTRTGKLWSSNIQLTGYSLLFYKQG